jgi:KaiC/GvpD/RAD55 family RecA-like ATPase
VQREFLALVSLHHGHRNKTPSETFGIVENGSPWQNAELPIDALIEHVLAGKAWTACQLAAGKRNASNAGASNLIVLDIDGDLSLDAFWAGSFAARHCLLTYTSCSHNPDGEHRFRALFPCEQHDDLQLHRAIYQQLIAALGFAPKDASGEKPERLWFGNTNAEIRFGGGELLSWDLIERAREEQAAAAKPRPATPRTHSSADIGKESQQAAWIILNLLRSSVDGDYSGGYWTSLLLNAAATGSIEVQEAFLEWHSRGHHAKTQKHIERRLNSRVSQSPEDGFKGIRAKAKDQYGDSWQQELPEDLRFGGGSTGAQPPTVLMRARSAADIAPAGGTISFSQKPAATVPDVVPTAAALEQLASRASIMQTSAKAAQAVGSSNAQTTPAAHIRQLINLIYWLKVENIHRGPGADALLSEEEAEDQIDEYTSELLAYPVFTRQPERIELKLLQEFRRQHGVTRRSRSSIKARHLYDATDTDREPMIGNLMARGCSYILYAKQGVGKTKLAFLLCRSALGTPGHSRFLDFQSVPQPVWGNQRVLYIASDGDDNAGADLRRYSDSMRQRDAQWLNFFDVIDGNQENKAARWRIDLFDLHLLSTILDEAAAAGTPYRLVVIDSLKAVAPDGKRVGDQIITDYVDLVNSICSPRQVTVLYVHHQAKEGDNAQGAAGLLEMVHGVFRLKEENGQSFFCVDKTRLDERGRREIPYQICPNGDLKIATYAADEDANDQGEELILRAFQQHYDKHLQRVAHLHKTDLSRSYKGINKDDFMLLLRGAGPTHSSWRSIRNVVDIINQMIKDGSLKRLKNKQAAIAGADPFTQVTTEQLQISPQTQQADQQGERPDDLPGW